MPNYRRAYVPGGTFFFTVVTCARVPIFSDSVACKLLGVVFREAISKWPMDLNAIVLLPDHLHMICSLPAGDDEYSKRIGWIKKEFTKRWLVSGGGESTISQSKRNERRRGIWQPRFWEHTIEEDEDFDNHFDYIHWNPVKHGYVKCPKDWPHSSFHRHVKAGVYPVDWGCCSVQTSENAPPNLRAIKDAGEP